jgi:hypothetical protein
MPFCLIFAPELAYNTREETLKRPLTLADISADEDTAGFFVIGDKRRKDRVHSFVFF